MHLLYAVRDRGDASLACLLPTGSAVSERARSSCSALHQSISEDPNGHPRSSQKLIRKPRDFFVIERVHVLLLYRESELFAGPTSAVTAQIRHGG